MNEVNLGFYDYPSQIEQWEIEESIPLSTDLVGLAHELCIESARLDARVNKKSAKGLGELIAWVNCYYSNLIENHKTLPIDIDKTTQNTARFGADKDHYSLACAHIAADRWAKTQQLTQANLSFFLQETHRLFCEHLPVEVIILEGHSAMMPGESRQLEVPLGRNLLHKREELYIFLNRYTEVYGRWLEWVKKGGIPRLRSIVAVFLAHHRLVRFHPFSDGNNFIARIMLDAMLKACGVNGTALWSMSRGLAKKADTYKSLLAQAGEPRHDNLAYSGYLTKRGLAEFCRFGLQVGIDQAKFMADMFDLDSFGERVDYYFRHIRTGMLRPESAYLYMYAWTMGEFERGEAARLTGLGERTARSVLGKLVIEGFLISDTPKGKVRVGFPAHAVSFLLPNLCMHGDVDTMEHGFQTLYAKEG